MKTLKDLLQTGRNILSTHSTNSFRTLSQVYVPERHIKYYEARKMRANTFCLYLTNKRASEIQTVPGFRWGADSPTEMYVCTTSRTPAGVPMLLAVLSIALVIDTDMMNNPSTDVLLTLMLATDRGIPVYHVGDDEPRSSILSMLVTHSVPTVSEVLSSLNEMLPLTKFPFVVLSDANRQPVLKPEAPLELLCAHEPGSPLHQLALSRCASFFQNSERVAPLRRGHRYFAVLYGDMCMCLEDDSGNIVFSLADFPKPVIESTELAN